MRSSICLMLVGICLIANEAIAIQNGFYLGSEAGVADLVDKESHSNNPEYHPLNAAGPIGGGFVGYDYGITCKTRIAMEAFADVSNLQTKIEHANLTYKMNQHYSVGARFLPEYVFTPYTMGHIILGYVNTRFHIKDNGVYGVINTRYHRNGFQTGVGMTTSFKNNFSIRLDALYDIYPTNTNEGLALSDSNSSQFYTNRFNQFAGVLSLYYKWI